MVKNRKKIEDNEIQLDCSINMKLRGLDGKDQSL